MNSVWKKAVTWWVGQVFIVVCLGSVIYCGVSEILTVINLRENEARKGEVVTVYNSDGELIGVMWTPEKGIPLEYIAGVDGVPRFVARREARHADVLDAAEFDDTVRQ